MPAGAHPTAIAFSEGSSSVVVAAQMLSGSSLFMYGDVGAKPSGDGKQQAKLPVPEIKWEHPKIHDHNSVLNLSAASATYGSADGSTVIASCSEGRLSFRWLWSNYIRTLYAVVLSGDTVVTKPSLTDITYHTGLN